MGCISCKIAERKIPSKIVYEDEIAIAFEDINPQAPVHVRMVPKKHISTNLDLTDEDNLLISHLFQVANRVAIEMGITERGFRLVMNSNRNAGQTVFHIHRHLPGGRTMQWLPG